MVCFENVDRPTEAIVRRCNRRSGHQPSAITFAPSREPPGASFRTNRGLAGVISDETKLSRADSTTAEIAKLEIAEHLCLLSSSLANFCVLLSVVVAWRRSGARLISRHCSRCRGFRLHAVKLGCENSRLNYTEVLLLQRLGLEDYPLVSLLVPLSVVSTRRSFATIKRSGQQASSIPGTGSLRPRAPERSKSK